MWLAMSEITQPASESKIVAKSKLSQRNEPKRFHLWFMDFLTVHGINIDNKVSTRTMLYQVSSLKKGYLGPAFVRLISCKPWLIPSRSEMLNWSREKSKFSFKTPIAEIHQCTALNHHQKKSNNFVGFCLEDKIVDNFVTVADFSRKAKVFQRRN